ncbi:MAG: hypothetical protein ACLQM8_01790, partial [Limisphaerales bacterium]
MSTLREYPIFQQFLVQENEHYSDTSLEVSTTDFTDFTDGPQSTIVLSVQSVPLKEKVFHFCEEILSGHRGEFVNIGLAGSQQSGDRGA